MKPYGVTLFYELDADRVILRIPHYAEYKLQVWAQCGILLHYFRQDKVFWVILKRLQPIPENFTYPPKFLSYGQIAQLRSALKETDLNYLPTLLYKLKRQKFVVALDLFKSDNYLQDGQRIVCVDPIFAMPRVLWDSD